LNKRKVYFDGRFFYLSFARNIKHRIQMQLQILRISSLFTVDLAEGEREGAIFACTFATVHTRIFFPAEEREHRVGGVDFANIQQLEMLICLFISRVVFSADANIDLRNLLAFPPSSLLSSRRASLKESR
jgi:hypothetical protein